MAAPEILQPEPEPEPAAKVGEPSAIPIVTTPRVLDLELTAPTPAMGVGGTVPAHEAPGPCTHVLVVGFDHAEGNVLDFVHPVFPGTPASAPRLPTEWRNLAFQALPDGVHKSSTGGVEPPPFFFALPALSTGGSPLYATACHRQVSTKDVRQRQRGHGHSPRMGQRDRMTRNAVQKSVVVVCKEPLYGLIVTRVQAATEQFAASGFSSEGYSELIRLLDGLNSTREGGLTAQSARLKSAAWEAVARTQRRRLSSMGNGGHPSALARAHSVPNGVGGNSLAVQQVTPWRPPPPLNPAFVRGSGIAQLLRSVGGAVFLKIIKAVLLQRRVVVHGSPAGAVSAAVLGIAACLPCALDLLASGEPASSKMPATAETMPLGGVPAPTSGVECVDSVHGWGALGLPMRPGWLSGGAVAGLQPHAALQALGEALVEGDSGGRLLGCSPNVARLLLTQMKRAADGSARTEMRADLLCDMGEGVNTCSSNSSQQVAQPRSSGMINSGIGGAPLAVDGPPSGRGGVVSSRCGALWYGNSELRQLLTLTKAEHAFAARLQQLAEAHEADLFIADAIDGNQRQLEQQRRAGAQLALELRLQGLLHSYIGGMLATAGSSQLAAGPSRGSGSKLDATVTKELRLRHGDRWVAAWQKTGAYATWAARLPLLQIQGAAWPNRAAVGPEELRRVNSSVSTPASAVAAAGSSASGAVYSAVSWLWSKPASPAHSSHGWQ